MVHVPAQLSTVEIREAVQHDAVGMQTIYNHEVENFTTTLDLRPRTVAEQQAWIAARSGVFRAIVAVVPSTERSGEATADGRRNEIVVGFASLSPFKERPAYSTTVENSVYVARSHTGRGIGRRLMDRLIDDARNSGFHSMIARIEASGEGSRALHRACGFELVGIEREVGRKFGRWLDVATMQLML